MRLFAVQVNKALLASSLPPRLRRLLLARTSSATLNVVNPSRKQLVTAVAAGSDEETALRRALAEDGRPPVAPQQDGDVRQPLLKNRHGQDDG